MQRRFFSRLLCTLRQEIAEATPEVSSHDVIDDIMKQGEYSAKLIAKKQDQLLRQQEQLSNRASKDRQELYKTLLNLKENALLQYQHDLQKPKEELLQLGYTESKIEYMQRMVQIYRKKRVSRLSFATVVKNSRKLNNVPTMASPFGYFLGSSLETKTKYAQMVGMDTSDITMTALSSVWSKMTPEMKQEFVELRDQQRQIYEDYLEQTKDKTTLLRRLKTSPLALYIKSRISELEITDADQRKAMLAKLSKDFSQLPETEKHKFKHAYLEMKIKSTKDKKEIVRQLQQKETDKIVSAISNKSFKK